MSVLQWLPGMGRRTVLVAGITLIGFFLSGATITVLLLREEALERGEENTANLAAVLAAQLKRSIQSADILVHGVARDAAARHAAGRRLSDRALHESLRERTAALTELQNVALLDQRGRLVNHSTRYPPPVQDYSDRDYFPVHRDRRVDGLFIGAPIAGRVVPGWQLTFSRRIEDRHGTFLGVASASIRIDRDHDFYGSLRLGEGGRVSIFRRDGIMLNTYPPADEVIGRSYADEDLFTQVVPNASSGVLERAGFIDGQPRIAAFERLEGYPLVVLVTSTERHLLKEWRSNALQLGAGAAAMSIIIALAMGAMLRQLRETAGLRGGLQEANERLQGVIHSAMDAIITIDEAQRIVLFNEAAEQIFGCPSGEVLGQTLDRFIPERFRAAHRRHVERFGATGTTTRRMGARMELYGLRASGEEFPIDASISQIAVGGAKYYTVILRDITLRKKAEQELQQAYYERRDANERLHGILQSAMDAIITMDDEQRVILFNDAAERIFRCRAAEAIGGPLARFIPQRFRAAHRDHVRRFGETRITTRQMGSTLQLFGLRADGEEFPIDASISQVTVGGRKLYTVILRDITDRRRAEKALVRSHEELRELSATMNEVREAERTRIARELHDELAQWLTALKMDVSWLASRLPPEHAPLLARTEKMRGVVDTTVTAVRRIAADLRPVMLDDLGLVPAIEGLLHDLSQRSGMVVSLRPDLGSLAPGEPVATSVYRMVQEALTNVARHAEASEVEVILRREGDMLVVHVRDNGKGYDAEAAGEKKSYGVLGIRERAYTLGGSARIHRHAAGGTVVHIEIPMTRFQRGGAADDSRIAG